MDGDETAFTELGPPNGENAVVEIYIFCLEIAGLTDAQARYRQQPQQAVIGRAPQTVSRRQPSRNYIFVDLPQSWPRQQKGAV